MLRKFLYALFVLLLAGCGKSEFFLDFTLPEDLSENFDVIYYATDKKGGLTIQAVASVMKGQCSLRGVTKLPTLIYLTAKKSKIPLVIYAERGNKITISGDSNEPLSWNVAGNDINQKLTAWREENLQTLKGANAESINKSVATFIENNPEDPVSLILLLCYFDRSVDENGYSDLMAALSSVDNKEQWITIAARADQMTLSAAKPARIESLALRSMQGGADTLFFDGKQPGLLMFWQNDIKNRKELMDSLKTVVKEFSDSTSRIIADINLDPDSIVWKNTIKRDSLKNVARLWAPAGLADESVMKLKVGSLPYYIVLNKKGQQIYRGSDFDLAVKEFRKMTSKKDTVKTSN